MRAWPFLLLAAVLAAQTQTGEITTREETPTFQSSVNLVRVPVVVRDKQGQTVGSFQKQDFHITDHGKPQEIAQFAIEGSAVAKPAGQPSTNKEIPWAPATEGSKLVVPTRFVAFVFDDVHLTLADFMNARAAALKHVEKGLSPQERIALFTLSGKISLEFTDDVAKFREMLMQIVPIPPPKHFPPASFYEADQYQKNPGSEIAGLGDPSLPEVLTMQTLVTLDCYPGMTAGVAINVARDTFRAVFNEGTSAAVNAFRVLTNLVRLLGSMPGDRVMIFVSPGIYLNDELQRGLSESIDRATRLGVVINTLDARGVYAADTIDPVPGCRLTSPQTLQEVTRFDSFTISSQGLILGDLAHSTGGTALAQNDLSSEFNRLANPPEFVYYLGFYPKDLKPDGKFHEIKVTLANGKGLSVQARKGYWAPSHLEDAAATATREIGEAVFARDELRDVPIDIHTQFYKTGADDAKVKVTTHLDIRQLPLRKQDDRNNDDVTLVCALFDRNGNYVKGTQKVVELRLKDESLERRRNLGITVNSDLDVKAGAYMIRVVVRDAEGKQMAATNGVVEIP